MYRGSVGSGLRRRMEPERAWAVIGSAWTWIVLVLLVHSAGRIGAVCAPAKFDSFVYAVAAFKMYDPAATSEDLVPDKPGGQALLTGWSYRVLPGPPTRLSLIPIESVFLLGGYLVFGLMAGHLLGGRVGPFLCFLLALGMNTYNTLDSSVAGLNVNENYMMLPMVAAAAAHLRVGRAWPRGLLAGLAIGTAMTIKQTAGGLLAVLLVGELSRVLRREGRLEGLKSTAGLLVGCVVAWVPLAAFLYARDWWWPHLERLVSLSGRHMAWMPLSVPPGFKLVPLAPAAWWAAAGLAAAAAVRWSRWYRGNNGDRHAASVAFCACRGSETGSSAAPTSAASNEPVPVFAGRPTDRPGGPSHRYILVFTGLWLAVEVAILWAMTKRSAHYYQQLVPPAVLLAGVGLAELRRALDSTGLSGRKQAGRWLLAGGATVILLAGLPLAAEATRRVRTFDYQREIGDFQFWLEHWSAQSLADDGGLRIEERRIHSQPADCAIHASGS